MATGRSHLRMVMDVQVLVAHAASVAMMEREMGYPPRLIRTPDVCYLFHAHEGGDQTAHASHDAQGSDGTMYTPPETEACFEEIERCAARTRRRPYAPEHGSLGDA